MSTIFIRNDDVRGSLDNSLIYLTERILSADLRISHAVEPANVSDEVAKWLNKMKNNYPDQIEIIQHGLNHLKRAGGVKGEFGGNRRFYDQLTDILHGREIMDRRFSKNWFFAFSFPYGTYNRDTLMALEYAKYKVISTGMNRSLKRRALNIIGNFLNRKHIGKYNIIYNAKIPPGYTFLELPVMINNTKRLLISNGGLQKNKHELLRDWGQIKKNKVVGVLTHHRYNSNNDIDNLLDFLILLKNEGARFATLEKIYEQQVDCL